MQHLHMFVGAAFQAAAVEASGRPVGEVQEALRRAGVDWYGEFHAAVDARGREIMRDRGLALDSANWEAALEILGGSLGVDRAAVAGNLGRIGIYGWCGFAAEVLRVGMELMWRQRGDRPEARPTAWALLEHARVGVFPGDRPAVVEDFKLYAPERFEALAGPVRCGELSVEDLDRMMGDPAAIEEAVNRSPSNPHKGISFRQRP